MSDRERQIENDVTYMWNLKNIQTNIHEKQKQITGIENELVVPKGNREGRWEN